MAIITAKEMAKKWNVSEQMVRKYCRDGRVEGAYQDGSTWLIPEKSVNPTKRKKEAPKLPKLLKKLIKQRDTGRYTGHYDYLQINMVYSNGRMASNRLTREQVEMLFKKDKIFTPSEAIKVNDIIEARNHFLCVDKILSLAMQPLKSDLPKQLQKMLLSESCTHKRNEQIVTGFRKTAAPSKFGKCSAPEKIAEDLNNLFAQYEKKKEIGFYDILELHVMFERIRPFEDCNGRVGRLIMLKECLRHDVMPFIIDDKRRSGYLEGLRKWDEDRRYLADVCMEAQMRFEAQVEVQDLLKSSDDYMRENNLYRFMD